MAIEWLKKAYEERDPTFFLVRSVPSHDCMRNNLEFKALLLEKHPSMTQE